MLVLEPSVTMLLAIKPGFQDVLGLTVPVPAAVAVALSTESESCCSSRPLEVGWEQQQRQKRRVELRVGAFGGSPAVIRSERRATGASLRDSERQERVRLARSL